MPVAVIWEGLPTASWCIPQDGSVLDATSRAGNTEIVLELRRDPTLAHRQFLWNNLGFGFSFYSPVTI